MADILRKLAQAIMPYDANAKIYGTPEAVALLKDMLDRADKAKEDYMTNMYKKIINYSDKVPDIVTVQDKPGLQSSDNAVAQYLNNNISYDPNYSKPDIQHSLAHELLHFLNSISKQPQGEAMQHAIIKNVLGADKYIPVDQLQGYKPVQLPPDQQQILNSWFGNGDGSK